MHNRPKTGRFDISSIRSISGIIILYFVISFAGIVILYFVISFANYVILFAFIRNFPYLCARFLKTIKLDCSFGEKDERIFGKRRAGAQDA